ncbi:MAG: 2-dehydro-3-deoxygalactonokinase [Halothiobacillaceae bacterium]
MSSSPARVADPQPAEVVGIDWGTTHLRAYRVAPDGQVLASCTSDDGLLRARGRFGQVCAAVIERLGARAGQLPVILSGMVGSSQGWQPVDYLGIDQPLRALGAHLVPLRAADALPHCYLVPGYAVLPEQAGPEQGIEVMRGEEVQLFGALLLEPDARSRMVVLPGTHSKWAEVGSGMIRWFATYMTGELFACLSEHGTLAALMARSEAAPQAFAAGVRRADASPLAGSLFSCRALVVTGAMPAEHSREYLSGMLIGAELHEALARGGPLARSVSIVASNALARRYQDAAGLLGIQARCLDPDTVYVAALRELSRALPPE